MKLKFLLDFLQGRSYELIRLTLQDNSFQGFHKDQSFKIKSIMFLITYGANFAKKFQVFHFLKLLPEFPKICSPCNDSLKFQNFQ